MLAAVLVAAPLAFSSASDAAGKAPVNTPASANNPIPCNPTWDVSGTYVIAFNLHNDPTIYAHDAVLTQTGTNITGVGGGYPAGGTHTFEWVIDSGTVTGTTINLIAHYTLGAVGTTMNMTGTIAPGGTMYGTWDDNYGGGTRIGEWSTTSGAATETTTCKGNAVKRATGGITMSGPSQQIEFNAHDQGISSADKGSVEYWNYDYPGVLHYTANVLCANVNPEAKDAWFMFQIPAGWPGLSGLYVVSYVHDGGTPGTNGDLYGHTASADLATAQAWCENGTASVSTYTITSGNLVVHK